MSDPERVTLAEIGKRVGRKALREIACVAKPDTILAWYRKLVAKKFDGSSIVKILDGRTRMDISAVQGTHQVTLRFKAISLLR